MVDIKVTETELRAVLIDVPASPWWCPLRAFAKRMNWLRGLDAMAAALGLVDTQAQAWAIMAGWDDTSHGPWRGPGRYRTHFSLTEDAAWYALGARLAAERKAP